LLSRQASIAVAWDILIFPCKTHSEWTMTEQPEKQ
jgi:hypothetical protein